MEAHLFGDKPVYVTNAYRKHQEEQAKYEAELNKKCAGSFCSLCLLVCRTKLPVMVSRPVIVSRCVR